MFTKRWSKPEKRALEIYARGLARGRYHSILEAAQACRRYLDRLRRERPGDPGLTLRRSESALQNAVVRRARELNWIPLHGDWPELEKRILEPYAQDLAHGRYRTAREASRAYQQHRIGLHRKSPRARWLAVSRPLRAVISMLNRRARQLGRQLPRPWCPEEKRLLVRYARQVVAGRYSGARQAARKYLEEIARRRKLRPDLDWLQARRSLQGVHAKILLRAREFGRPRLRFRWSSAEKQLVTRYAVLLARRRYLGSRHAAKYCLEAIQGLGRTHPELKAAVARRTLTATRGRLVARARGLGLRWSFTRWTPGERKLAGHYARAIVQGRFPSAAQGIRECWQALGHEHKRLLKERPAFTTVPAARTFKAVEQKLFGILRAKR